MRYPIRYPDGREFGPYTVEELEEYAAQKKFPPNTEIEANGEWVSLGGWLVVRKRIEQLQAAQMQAEESSKPHAAPPPTYHENPRPTPPGPSTSVAQQKLVPIAVGAILFVAVVVLAFFLR